MVVIASDVEMRVRICAALEGQGARIEAQLDAPSAIAEVAVDESTVLVVECDIDAPREMTGLRRLCREAPQAAIVVISPPSTGMGVRRTLDAGAHALVFEPELELTLATAVTAVTIGQSVVPRKLRAGVAKPALSHRENQVLVLVRSGLTNAEIAERLFLAESTIKSHLSAIFTKLGVRSRKEVAMVSLDHGLALDPELSELGDDAERASR